MTLFLRAVAVLFALGAAVPASATFSIVACDDRGSCGAAVATNNLAVGATVIYAKAGVGALASQFETNPSHGPQGLALLERGATAEAALRDLLRSDDGFDGQDASYRQIGIVDVAGAAAAASGARAVASPWTGTLTGERYSVQGNGLAGAAVLAAMRDAFLASQGPLANRLMAALAAGEKAGGQRNGRMSAALLVRTRGGGFDDVDLRVDAADQPVPALQRLMGMRDATAAIARAERAARRGDAAETDAALTQALQLGADWDRIWRRAARLQMGRGEAGAAFQALTSLGNINPVWARIEVQDPLYAPLWRDRGAAEWRAVLTQEDQFSTR